MTLRPGQTARAYIEGKRWSYLNPIKYILFTTTLFLLLMVLFFIVAVFLGAYNSFANYSGVVVGTILYLAWALVGFYRTRIWWATLTAFFMAVSYHVMGALMSFLIQFAVYVLR